MDYAANRRRDFSRDGPLPNHVTNTPAEPHLAHGESPLIVRAIQKDSVVLKYSSRGTTYGPYRRQFRVRERLPCRITNGAIYALQYDVLNDFEPIALLANNPQVIVAKKSMPANDLKGLIAWLKANPDKASAGTAGVGSPQHVLGIFFQSATGTRFQFVHYRGGGPATQDLVAGQIDIIVADQVTALPQIVSGNIKAYAVTNKNRLAAAPDIPTVDEAGLPEFYTTVWNAIWAPKGTPKNIIGKLNVAVVDGLSDSAVRPRAAAPGQPNRPPDPQTPGPPPAVHHTPTRNDRPVS